MYTGEKGYFYSIDKFNCFKSSIVSLEWCSSKQVEACWRLVYFVLIFLISDDKTWVGLGSVDAFIMLCGRVKIIAFASIVHFIIPFIYFLVFFICIIYSKI